MTFSLPTVNNTHENNGAGDPLFADNIGSPNAVNTKEAGNLPITKDGSQFTITADNQLAGVSYYFQATPASYDVSSSTKVLLWHNQFNAPNRIQVADLANGGVRFRLYSGTTLFSLAYKDWYIGGNDSPFAECVKGQVPFVMDLNAGNETSSAGTFDNTTVTRYGIIVNSDFVVGTQGNINFQGSNFVLGTDKGDADIPVFTGTSDFVQAVTLVQGTDYTNKIGNWIRQTGSVVYIDMPFQIGDNAASTQFNDNGVTVVSPASNAAADPRFQLTDQAMRVHLNLLDSAADTCTMTGTYLWGTRAAFNFDQSNLSETNLAGATFRGMGDLTIGSSVSGAATFDNTGSVKLSNSSVNINGSTISNTFASNALHFTGGPMNIANMRFESYAGKHAILIDTVGSYTLTDIFFDQSGTADIETTHTTGTVTINLVGTTTTPSFTNTGGGTVVLNFPNRTLTLNGIVAGSRILVTDTTNTVVLFNEVPSTSPFVGSIASAGTDVDLSIRVRNGAVPYKTFDTTATLTSAGVSINVSQVSDA
jgi:hypothetical protein